MQGLSSQVATSQVVSKPRNHRQQQSVGNAQRLFSDRQGNHDITVKGNGSIKTLIRLANSRVDVTC